MKPARVLRLQSRHSAVTLIEFLTAMLIIAVCIAIVAPSCLDARRAGRRTLCMTNLRQIGTAMGNYFNEYADIFPWFATCEYRDDQRTNQTWFYGGRYPLQATAPDKVAPTSRFEPQERPFNAYLYPTAVGRRVDLKLFMCPDDDGKRWVEPINQASTHDPGLCYLTTGASYTCNWWWMWYSGLSKTAYGTAPQLGRMPHYANQMTRYKLAVRGAGTFATLYGDPLDTMITLGRPIRGWHAFNREPGWSEMLLLDGHADLLKTDTAEGYETRVTEWTMWWNTQPQEIPATFKPPYPGIEDYRRPD